MGTISDISPKRNGEVITPNDNDTFEPSLILVGTAGNVNVDMAGVGENIAITIAAGIVHPILVTRVYSTGHGAGTVVRFWDE